MPKARRKTSRRHEAAVVDDQAPEVPPTLVTDAPTALSDSQLNMVVEKVAEKLLPLLPPRIEPEPKDSGEVQVGLVSNGISSQVSLGLKQKICNREYVNLSILLTPENSMGQVLTLDSNGSINLMPKTIRRISSIEAWTDAFIVYMDVYCQVHSDQYADMLKYLHTVRFGAKQYTVNGWISYDEQFRLKMAQSLEMSWAVVDQELWMLFMCRPKPQVANEQVKFKCYDFNYKGICQRSVCTFTHKCIKCGGSHSFKVCTSTGNNNNMRSNFRFAAPGGIVPSRPRPSTAQRPFMLHH